MSCKTTALRLSKIFWELAKNYGLVLQDDYDIEEERNSKRKALDSKIFININAAQHRAQLLYKKTASNKSFSWIPL